ncbi:hypothetical protein PFLA_a0196 [Pseudoalteromonas flavipulchra NCIMB 2033 = ATCC BAA-314]|nr:hypothetical protein [Pseudoalteromonas flavipulchra NCIMB 2033 = ATCC BAA-314]
MINKLMVETSPYVKAHKVQKSQGMFLYKIEISQRPRYQHL